MESLTPLSKDERNLRDLHRLARVRELEQAGIDPTAQIALWATWDREEDEAAAKAERMAYQDLYR